MSLNGSIRVPSDKSITHRALLFGMMANGTTHVRNPLLGADCRSTLEVILSLGADVTELQDELVIKGTASPRSARLDCGNSGTTMRLLIGLLSSYNGSFELVGDESLSRRPMRRVTEPLRNMGAHVTGDMAPLVIEGTTLRSIDYTLPVASAQVKSAVLLAGLHASGTTIVREPMLSRDHTERMLPLFGAKLSIVNEEGLRVIRVEPSSLTGCTVDVPADPSSAAFFWAGAAMVADSSVMTKDVCLNETRIGFLRTLERMGANVVISNERLVGEERVGDVTVTTSELTGTVVEKDLIPSQIDELPLFALVASQANSPSIVKDAAELRVKETDRIDVVVSELRKLGVDIVGTEDGFIVNPSRLHGGDVSTYGDHRLSMMLQIASLMTDEAVHIEGIEASDVSYPRFREDLQRVQRKIE
ncbi:3-phosphoshikimate 1-carboxyvinyltransferase (5-enolpyruvoylshikimate-3-phosphate synthase) [Exiguobacterium sp. 8H]|uniref:3-phosphoshikimate 1-carboxyvinyltransferase n=1 Tax=unclassified Exiguobacterium TaxID=2644629 RepID=UPI0012F211F9|nr:MULTISPECIES: 3-phosphoshikimate 1-carboxyvinyltransferase [unclassified Exiguobacterium]VXB11211.1 3-phosphoshikimate 1-carboxyvinyltransferase (5-enolpyruvoylshikimate-3-phosphate synthase) [Exiguobacterium sp. 8H]VXB11575.1 3-phosphoshikimate 1-carboxyvinyltransferase (5-enolpyruvoylshikimate-3-phosphate synthase) [Exiguobacterium sp. 8A]